MAKQSRSIVQQGDPRCFFCGRTVGLERHHILGGVANRPLSEQYGLWIWCCHDDHTGKDGVQYNKAKAESVKRLGQIAFEARHSHAEWMDIFKKNYI